MDISHLLGKWVKVVIEARSHLYGTYVIFYGQLEKSPGGQYEIFNPHGSFGSVIGFRDEDVEKIEESGTGTRIILKLHS